MRRRVLPMLFVFVFGFASVFAFVFMSACSLRETADKMKQTSEEIKAESQHLSKRTDDLEAELTKKESYAMFLKSMEGLFSEVAQDATSGNAALNPEPDQLLHAGAAIESMLFQFWKGDYNENINELDLRFQFSSEVLFVKCLKHIPRTFQVDVFNPDRSYTAIASLGAKLDRLTDKYTANLKLHGLPAISLYDLILTSLSHREQSQRDELLPKATAMILQYRREVIYMLQLRHNYLPMMVLGRLTDLQDRGLWGRLMMYMNFAAALTVDLNLAKVGPQFEELKEWTKWLNSALETRQALRKMGIEPEYNSAFVGILGNINLVGHKALLTLDPDQVQDPKLKVQIAFIKAYSEVLRDSQPPNRPHGGRGQVSQGLFRSK